MARVGKKSKMHVTVVSDSRRSMRLTITQWQGWVVDVMRESALLSIYPKNAIYTGQTDGTEPCKMCVSTHGAVLNPPGPKRVFTRYENIR